MSDSHDYSKPDSSLSTLILIAVVILGLFYFLAKGCTNTSADETPATHHAAIEKRGPTIEGKLIAV